MEGEATGHREILGTCNSCGSDIVPDSIPGQVKCIGCDKRFFASDPNAFTRKPRMPKAQLFTGPIPHEVDISIILDDRM